MSRSQTQLLNAGIGFALGYVVGAWLRGRRTGIALGLVLAAITGVASGRVYDQLDLDEIEDVEDLDDLDIESAASTAA
jgi:4-amino-4-deoxy-L-arabinose transferase-like glycosyltransferase